MISLLYKYSVEPWAAHRFGSSYSLGCTGRSLTDDAEIPTFRIWQDLPDADALVGTLALTWRTQLVIDCDAGKFSLLDLCTSGWPACSWMASVFLGGYGNHANARACSGDMEQEKTAATRNRQQPDMIEMS